MTIFKIYESYDENAFKDFLFHGSQLFPKYWDTLYKKFYDDIDYKVLRPTKVEQNRMKAEATDMLKFMAKHIKGSVIDGKIQVIKFNKIAHVTERNDIGDMITKNFAGVSMDKLQVQHNVSKGKIFRWFRAIDQLAIDDDDVGLMVLNWFCRGINNK